MREAKVEQVEHASDSDSDEKENEKSSHYTIGIFPPSQPPTYLLMNSKQEMVIYFLIFIFNINVKYICI